MVVTREDCLSIQTRQQDHSIVAATVVSIDPPIIQDSVGAVQIRSFPIGVERGDLCYFLLECSTRPFKCAQITPIPPQLAQVAHLQLSLYRQREKRH